MGEGEEEEADSKVLLLSFNQMQGSYPFGHNQIADISRTVQCKIPGRVKDVY